MTLAAGFILNQEVKQESALFLFVWIILVEFVLRSYNERQV